MNAAELICPHCNASMQGQPIPEESRQYYGTATHYSRVVGHQMWSVYDGVLFWACPDCGKAWPREGFTGRRAEQATAAVIDWNKRADLP